MFDSKMKQKRHNFDIFKVMSFFVEKFLKWCRILVLAGDIICIKKYEVNIMKNVFDLVWFVIVVSLMIFAGILFGLVVHILFESGLIILIVAALIVYFFGSTILDFLIAVGLTVLEILIAYEMAKEINKELDK